EYEVDPLGNTTSYHLIKGQNKKYDIDKNILLLNKTGEEYNKTKSLKKKFEAINKFLKECKKNGIIYKNH
ncbi:MAG: hypothetical protein II411_03595, partial [Lachnospiraceae bacterium]|nr:hypothetical protein [Lachnospiraceae bacterium]